MLRSIVTRASRSIPNTSRNLLSSSCTCRPVQSLVSQLPLAFIKYRNFATETSATSPPGSEPVVLEDGVKPPPPLPLPPLFTCTPADSARLTRLRNVGVSAHIELVKSFRLS